MKLAKRLENLGEYAFSRLARKKASVEARAGRKVLDLSIGSPDFPPSDRYIRKFQELVDMKDSHKYAGYGAVREFSDAIIYWYKKRFSVVLNANQLHPLNGAKDGVTHIIFALLDDGDQFLAPDPGYPGFVGPAELIGAKPIFYNLTQKNNFKISIPELKEKLTRKTRFIWINFPANPTGQTADLSELVPLVEFARKNGIWILYDNAYSEITFDGFVAPSILQIEGAIDVAVEIGSFSKTFSLAGDRIGYVVGNQKLVSALAKVKSQFDSGLSVPLQNIAAYILKHTDENWHKNMIREYGDRRDKISNALKKIGLNPTNTRGSLYLWVKIPDNFKNSEDFVFDLLEKRQVLLTPGSVFGENGKRYVRVSVCGNIKEINSYFK